MSESLQRARLISWLVSDYLTNAKRPIASRAEYLRLSFQRMTTERLQYLVDQTPTMRQRDNVMQMVNYLLKFEHDDFYYSQEQPSDYHIYYKAYEFVNGETEAKEMLSEAIKEWKNG